MKTFLITLCTVVALSAFALARDHHGMTPAQIAEQEREDADYERNKDLYDKLDAIEEQLQTLNQSQQDQEDLQPQPLTQPRVQTFADYAKAGKAQELAKSWQIGETRSVQTRDGQTINATLLGVVDSYQHLPRRGQPGDAWLVAGTPWVWEQVTGTDMATWIDL